MNDSQPQKAAEAIARGVAKFPNNTELLVDAAGMYREAGQLQQAAATLQRALQANPSTKSANLQLAQVYVDMGQPDSALIALRAAKAAGDSVPLVSGLAAQIGNKSFQAARESKDLADFERAIQFLSLADELTPGNQQYMFVLGTAAHSAAIMELQMAQKDKSCEPAQTAKEYFAIVGRVIPQSGSVSPASASQIMAQHQQYAPFADQMIKSFCK